MELNAIYKQLTKKTWQPTNIKLKYFNYNIEKHFKKKYKAKPQKRNIGKKKGGGYRPPLKPKQLNKIELLKIPHE